LAAYCRWREAEALVGAGASRAKAQPPLQAAHAAAVRLKAAPLLRELGLLADRARLELAPSPVARASEPAVAGEPSLAETLELTRREVEVLSLIARGFTNREIADELVISVKTAGVHVSHILQKLGAPNRREAAAIAHRVAAPASSPDATINA
jgi:DNA-binding NarL/FixJ family response regulator